jgi:fumarylacetoacetate (FAA) hydrolase family protein
MNLHPALPEDAAQARLAGRVWRPDRAGPTVVAIRDAMAVDSSSTYPTMRDLCETADPAAALDAAAGDPVASVQALLDNTSPATRDTSRPWLLTPTDLQAIKAAGVAFAVSMLERVIEERARGDMHAAGAIRQEVTSLVGDDLSKLKPGSAAAMRLKQVLIQQGAWSQ